MPMSNREVFRYVREFQKLRRQWIDILVKTPRHKAAAQHVIDITSKIELLETLINWTEDVPEDAYDPNG